MKINAGEISENRWGDSKFILIIHDTNFRHNIYFLKL